MFIRVSSIFWFSSPLLIRFKEIFHPHSLNLSLTQDLQEFRWLLPYKICKSFDWFLYDKKFYWKVFPNSFLLWQSCHPQFKYLGFFWFCIFPTVLRFRKNPLSIWNYFHFTQSIWNHPIAHWILSHPIMVLKSGCLLLQIMYDHLQPLKHFHSLELL